MTGWLGAELHELELCDSTNDEAAALFESFTSLRLPRCSERAG